MTDLGVQAHNQKQRYTHSHIDHALPGEIVFSKVLDTERLRRLSLDQLIKRFPAPEKTKEDKPNEQSSVGK